MDKSFGAAVKRIISETDKLLILLCVVASVFGAVMVYSATIPDITEGQAYSRDFRTMVIAVVLGLVIAFIISLVDYNIIIKAWPVIAVVCAGLMVLTYFIGVGPDGRSDVKSWIKLPGGLYFQPSELVKIGFIITFGMHLELKHDKINELKTVIFLCVHAAVPTLLVIVTGDLGSALIFMIIFVGMMFMAGLRLLYFGIGIAAVGIATPFIWKFLLKDLQKDRFLALIHPEDYSDIIYQQKNCITAIGAGKLTGMGLFNGTFTQANLVPEAQNDMIFSVIGEELGFVGCIVALGILAAIIIKIIRTAKTAGDRSAALMCYGLASMLIGHIVVNIGMCLMLLPVVGITLPFYSAGGSSNLCLYIGIGLALSIYRFSLEHNAVNFKLSGIRTPFTE